MELSEGEKKAAALERSWVYEPELTHLVRVGILQPFPSAKISNQVEWVNNGFRGGDLLDFQKGHPTSLAVGLIGKAALKVLAPDRLVYCRLNNYRSGILSTHLEGNYRGQRFNYLDVKGLGHLMDDERPVTSETDPRYSTFLKAAPITRDLFLGDKTWGLVSGGSARADVRGMRKLEKLGVRTVPIIAVTRIKEVIDDQGNRVSVADATKSGFISPAATPIEAFRAWVTPFRLQDVVYTPEEDKKYGVIATEKDIERKRNILRQAIFDIKDDGSIPLSVRQDLAGFDLNSYLKWLVFSIGDGLGRMNSRKVTHGVLRALHNLTLDGRFVDLDGIEGSSDSGVNVDRLGKDYKAIFDTSEPFYADFLQGVIKLFGLAINPADILAIAHGAYSSHFE